MVDLTEDQAHRSCQWGSLDLSFAEMLLYNMRHVQHHAAQLNLLLRQNIDSARPASSGHISRALDLRDSGQYNSSHAQASRVHRDSPVDRPPRLRPIRHETLSL